MQEDGNQAYSAVPALRSPHEYKPVLKLQSTALDIINGEGEDLSPRRLRRKIGSQPELRSRFSSLSSPNSPHASQFPISAVSIDSFPIPSPNPDRKDGGEREEGLEEAVGQLSLNEDEQVRFHGKASGLHLLGVKERIDGRNEGGIWCVRNFIFFKQRLPVLGNFQKLGFGHHSKAPTSFLNTRTISLFRCRIKTCRIT